ncbi:MAG: Hsp20/alpha crystallin family protein [Chthoniobacterales bacterium]
MYFNTLTTTDNQAADGTRYATPQVDFHANAEGTQLVLDVPGVAQGDVEITVEDQRLTIIGHRKNAEPVGEWVHQEIRPFDYRRVFSLASSIDTNRIQAELRDGVLSLNLPLAERVKPRRIEVA